MKERFTRAYFPLCRLVSSLLGPSTCMRVGWSLKEGRSVPRPWQQMPPTPPRNDEVPPKPCLWGQRTGSKQSRPSGTKTPTLLAGWVGRLYSPQSFTFSSILPRLVFLPLDPSNALLSMSIAPNPTGWKKSVSFSSSTSERACTL